MLANNYGGANSITVRLEYINSKDVAVNVHYIPMPMLTLFKNKNVLKTTF